ncbi:hypothetical protein GCM10023143_21570 [Compostibacter hankyongensis]|uniref:Uncharacterized protein n=2 Tax=Compostibacter hankyongensis TaxID=1007089 RepID=A0ABP8FVV6_9BACT
MDSIAWPMDSLSGAGMRAELKSVEISVDTGGTYLQGKALEGKSMHLDKVLEQLLVAQWQRYGSLPDTLKLHFSDDILMGGRGAVQDKIDQALEILRDTVSLSRYQMTYRKTGNNQKARLRREYPLLFPRKAGY